MIFPGSRKATPTKAYGFIYSAFFVAAPLPPHRGKPLFFESYRITWGRLAPTLAPLGTRKASKPYGT